MRSAYEPASIPRPPCSLVPKFGTKCSVPRAARSVKPPLRHSQAPRSDTIEAPPAAQAQASWRRVSPSPEVFERDNPGAEALATECAINLLHVRDLVWARFDRLVRRHAIPSPSGFVILSILAGADAPLPPHEIAQRMFLTPGTMTGLVGTLQTHGYVTTAKATGRGRHLLIDITEEGRQIQRQANRELDLQVVKWLACFDETEKLSLLRLLGLLGAHLKTADP